MPITAARPTEGFRRIDLHGTACDLRCRVHGNQSLSLVSSHAARISQGTAMTAASDKDYIDKGYLTEADSAEVVIGRNDPTRNPRLAEVMAVIVRHLHAAVKEIEPTQEEWFAAIQFLTRTGHTCTDWRQGVILLFYILRGSMVGGGDKLRPPPAAAEDTGV